MEFRPCIDIHNGLVKQIVGSSLQDEGDVAQESLTVALSIYKIMEDDTAQETLSQELSQLVE